MNTTLPPGPSTPKLLQVTRFFSKPWDYLWQCRRQFGPIFTMRLIPASFFRIVWIGDPESVAKIYALPAADIEVGEGARILEPIVGQESLLLSDGARHTRKRKLILPPLFGEHVRALGDEMQEITSGVIDAWPQGPVFRLREEMSRITLAIIVRTVLGVTKPSEVERFCRLSQELIARSEVFLAFPFLRINLGRYSPYGTFLAVRARLCAQLSKQIAARRKVAVAERSGHILDLLLAARDEAGAPLGETELIDELMTLLMTGYETTSLGLTWSIHELLKHPHCVERVRAEVQTVTGGGPVKSGDVAKLSYTRACFLETLRKYPVLFFSARRILKPAVLGPFSLPARSVVGISPLLLHYDESIWPEPAQFNPERFVAQKPAPGTFLAFGGGTRRCAGAEFATFEATLVLAEILRRVDLQAVRDVDPMIRYGVEIAPKHGMEVQLLARRPNYFKPE